jgi:autotransporter-associated beta strand protein
MHRGTTMSTLAKTMKRLAAFSLAALMITAVIAATASAAALSWTPTSGIDWSTPANWTGGTLDDTSDVTFTATGGTAMTVPPTLPLTATNTVTGGTTINTLWYRQPDTTVAGQVTQISPGVTLKIQGSVTASTDYNTSETYSLIAGATGVSTSQTIFTGGGSLDVSTASNGNTGGDVIVSQVTSSSGTRNASLDLSGLSLFNANVDQVLVGYTVNVARPAGLLYLAQTNTIRSNNPSPITDVTSAGLVVGYSSGNASGSNSYLYLGQTNAIYTDGVMIGGRRSTNAYLTFNPAFTGTSLVMRGKDYDPQNNPDVRVAWINIGDNTNNTGTGGTTNANGTVTLTDGNVDIKVGTITIGLTGNNDTTNSSTGVLTFNKGTIDATGMIVGKKATAAGTVRSSGTGTVNVSGTGNLIVGSQGITLATYLSTGSGTASGILNFTGGTVTLGGDIIDGGDGTNGSSTLKLDGAVLDMGGHNIGTTIAIDTLNLYSGTIKNIGGMKSTIGGAGLVKNWDNTTAKTLILDGVNTYTGDTKVTGGTLKLASTVSIASSVIDVFAGTLDVTAFADPVGYTIAGGKTIKGNGSVNGSITVLGTLAAGESPGILTVNGNTTLSGTDAVETNNATAGTGYDQLVVNGSSNTVALAGTLALTVSPTFTPAGEAFWIVVNNSSTALNGTFGAVTGLPDGWNVLYNVNYDAITPDLTPGSGNDVAIVAVPEPATMLMLIVATGLGLLFKRFRNK